MKLKPLFVVRLLTTFLFGLVLGGMSGCANVNPRVTRQKSVDEWRGLTSAQRPIPRVFAKGDNVRFYLQGTNGVELFQADWRRVRVPTDGYRVNSAVLRWQQKLSRMPNTEHGWREAIVIGGAEWRLLSSNLVTRLTPPEPMHGAYYQAFLSDRLVYRGPQGTPRLVALSDAPTNAIIDHRYSVEETLEIIAHSLEEQLASTHPGGSLFVIMAPDSKRFTQPLLVDRQRKRCVFLAPAALYDTTERGLTLQTTLDGLSAFVLESHGIALLKNPVSSGARLADFALESVMRFVRLPLPHSHRPLPPPRESAGMDLQAWESWLDRYTGTRQEQASLDLLIDGDQFFTRLQQGLAQATNRIAVNMYIFDRDDVAVKVADQLKQRSREIQVQVLMDRMGSLGGAMAPPATPLPEDFEPPASISGYLRRDSNVQVRSFLNPWFSANHQKVVIADGSRAWLGGMNFGREYRYEWHDLMLEVTGPMVGSLESEFKRVWAHSGPFGDLGYAAALLNTANRSQPPPGTNLWVKARLLPTRTGWKPFLNAVRNSLERAQRYIYVENPYLFDKKVIVGLVRARQRGVDVRVVLPRVNEFKAGGRSNLVLANYLLENGVRVYFYPAMSHVKALMVDDWTCIGSGNLNHLSLRLNQEQNIATSDAGFAARVKKELFEQDLMRSYELTQPISVGWVDFVADRVLESF